MSRHEVFDTHSARSLATSSAPLLSAGYKSGKGASKKALKASHIADKDPIFAAIEHHRKAEGEYGRCLDACDKAGAGNAEDAALAKATKASRISLQRVLAVPPSDKRSARVLLSYALAIDWQGGELAVAVRSLLASSVLT